MSKNFEQPVWLTREGILAARDFLDELAEKVKDLEDKVVGRIHFSQAELDMLAMELSAHLENSGHGNRGCVHTKLIIGHGMKSFGVWVDVGTCLKEFAKTLPRY